MRPRDHSPHEQSSRLLEACDKAFRAEAETIRHLRATVAALKAENERLARELDYADARLQQWGVRR